MSRNNKTHRNNKKKRIKPQNKGVNIKQKTEVIPQQKTEVISRQKSEIEKSVEKNEYIDMQRTKHECKKKKDLYNRISLALSIIAIIVTVIIAKNTSDFDNKNAALDTKLSKVEYLHDDGLKVTIEFKQGMIKKAYLADIDGDNIKYSKQDVIKNKGNLEINIPAKSEKIKLEDRYYNFINTKQFALIFFDYNSNIYCYYVVLLAKPYMDENIQYGVEIKDMDGNVVDKFQRDLDGIKYWSDGELLIDCSLTNEDTIEPMINNFKFDREYPLFDQSKTAVGENGKITSNPKLEFHYDPVSKDEIYNNISRIRQDINNSIN